MIYNIIVDVHTHTVYWAVTIGAVHQSKDWVMMNSLTFKDAGNSFQEFKLKNAVHTSDAFSNFWSFLQIISLLVNVNSSDALIGERAHRKGQLRFLCRCRSIWWKLQFEKTEKKKGSKSSGAIKYLHSTLQFFFFCFFLTLTNDLNIV